MNDEGDEAQWLAVIGRSLAFLCLQHAELGDKDLLTQNTFLESLGIRHNDIAALLRVSPKSLTQAKRRARGQKGKKNANANKKR